MNKRAHDVGAIHELPLRNKNEQAQGLPEGWEWTRLHDIAEINPKPDKSSIPDNLLVSFVPMPSVGAGDGKIDVSVTRPFSEVKKGFTPFQSGDVLFAKITPCMENGKIAVVPYLENRYGFGSTEFHVIRPKTEIDARYIYYFVSRLDFRKEAASKMTGAVGQKRVPTDFIKQSQLPLAPLPQQKLIVAEIEKQFSRLDEAVAGLERVKVNLKRYKASVLKAAVEGKLTEEWRKQNAVTESGADLLKRILAERRAKWEEEQIAKMRKNPKNVGAIHELPLRDDAWKKKYKEPVAPDTSNLPELPEGWVWASLDQISQADRPITYGVIKLGEHIESGVPTLRSSNVRHLRIDLNGIKKISHELSQSYHRTILQGGEVVITVRGTLGGVASVPKSFTGFNVSREVAVIAPLTMIENTCLAIFIGSKPLQNWLYRQAKGIAYTGINIETLKIAPVPIPSLAEQQLIVAEVDRRLSVAEEIEAVIETNLKRAERMRQAILKKAFEGRLVKS